MIKPKLKPCPFCGGDADFRIRFHRPGISQMKVVCMKCRIVTPRGALSSDEFKCDKEYTEAAERAAKKWNSRTE